MWSIILPSIFLLFFSIFNLVGIKKELLQVHLEFIVMGAVGFFVVRKVGVRFFRQNAGFFYWLFIVIMIVTYIIGVEVKGSQRWIDLYFFRFQPSEFYKVFFILFLADFLSKTQRFEADIHVFLKGFLFFLLPTAIIFKQPDLGTALVFVAIFLAMMLFSGITRRYIGYLLIALVLLFPLFWNVLHDYQRDRLTAFVGAHAGQQATSYNMTQSIIAAGSGQLFGRGLGMGKQSRLYFLPEYHTDFAYSSLVEQFGFFGGSTVILLYAVLALGLVTQIVNLYPKTDESSRFHFLCLIGLLTFMMFQIVVNIGMNIGVLPIAGITLPLISYGGSSLISYCIALALLLPDRSG